MADCTRDYGVTIGVRLGARFEPDDAVGAGPVIHNDGFVPTLVEPLRHQPYHGIETATGGLRHDHAHGFVGIGKRG